jgi:hypothetical protein
MQDIPRGELLDKLADGWTVRRKSWKEGRCISKSGGNTSISGSDLIEDDWEGISPHSILKTVGCRIIYSMTELSEGRARFVRRNSWGQCVPLKRCEKQHAPFELSIEDIVANDWEIWQ